MSVLPLKTERCESSQAAIILLEHILDEARNGEVVAVGVAVVRPGSHINCGFTDFDNAGLLIGASALLQARLIANMAPK